MIKIIELSSCEPEQLKLINDRAALDIAEVREQTQQIIDDVKSRGDDALVELTRKFDDKDFTKSRLIVTKEEINKAYKTVPKSTISHIRDQISLARKFHNAQLERVPNWEAEIEPGIIAGERWTPVPSCGLYVPGGKNPFPTVQQILAIPASIAGCPRIISCMSPRGENHEVLIAAHECGVEEIYRVSGAHAIAAMAYGTETIKPIDLIAGPGSPYVTAAKIIVQEKVAIDMPAGPSEAIMLADNWVPKDFTLIKKSMFLAADILARAEHGPDSAGVMVTDSMELAKLTAKQIEVQFEQRKRKEHIKEALARYSAIIVTRNMDEAIDFTNNYAPEHLELLTEDPRQTLAKVKHAGSVFLGLYNPVAAGDYASGVNHILPTGGWAKRSSAVSVWTFLKRVQFSDVSEKGLSRIQPIVDCIADVEGLDAHRFSVDIRLLG